MLLRAIIGVLLLLWPIAVMAADIVADAPTVPKTALQDDLSQEDTPQPQYNIVVLQGLNKVTGNISKLEGPVGTLMRFGNLEIIAHRCWKSDPDERPENAALLEISELKPGEAPQKIFLGWMFSSSPGLSGLEHPVYDITVMSCEASEEPEKSDKPEKEKTEKKE